MSYARVVLTDFKPGTFDTLNRKAEEELVPLFRQIPGFVSYRVAQIDDRSLVAIGILETRGAAEEMQRIGAGWMKNQKEIASSRHHIAEVKLEAGAMPAEAHPVI